VALQKVWKAVSHPEDSPLALIQVSYRVPVVVLSFLAAFILPLSFLSLLVLIVKKTEFASMHVLFFSIFSFLYE
jgi:hypothetical protein